MTETRGFAAGNNALGAGTGAALSVANLSAGYGKVVVLRDVSFEALPGEALGIAGPNGAGKTTLLNALAGLNRCEGQLTLGGTPLQRAPAHSRVRQGLALVPEGRQVIGSLTVLANLDLTAMARGKLRLDSEHELRRAQILEMFPRLAERLDALGSVLSGGEQQMLAIARALIASPRLIMLDEPSEGIMPVLVDEMFDLFRQLKSRGVTILLVEQNVELALGVADRAYVIDQGAIAHHASARELLADAEIQEKYCAV